MCVCRQKPCLIHLLSLFLDNGAVRETSCATLLSVTLAAISLSPLPVYLIICSLSTIGAIIHVTGGDKEESLSSAPERLQRATAPPAGEPRTGTYRLVSCMD